MILQEAQNLRKLQTGQSSLLGGENPTLHHSDFTGRGLHSPTSQLNISRFGQYAGFHPVCNELLPIYLLKVPNVFNKKCSC